MNKCKNCELIGYRLDEEVYAYCSKTNKKVNRFKQPKWCPKNNENLKYTKK